MLASPTPLRVVTGAVVAVAFCTPVPVRAFWRLAVKHPPVVDALNVSRKAVARRTVRNAQTWFAAIVSLLLAGSPNCFDSTLGTPRSAAVVATRMRRQLGTPRKELRSLLWGDGVQVVGTSRAVSTPAASSGRSAGRIGGAATATDAATSTARIEPTSTPAPRRTGWTPFARERRTVGIPPPRGRTLPEACRARGDRHRGAGVTGRVQLASRAWAAALSRRIWSIHHRGAAPMRVPMSQ